MTLKQTTFSAVRWTTAAAFARGALQLAQVAVLARLLAPEDYGLMAIVGVILSVTALFADFGLNSAYVQKRDVTPEQRASLFWLNTGLSVALMLLVMACSPLLASFFGDARLTPLLMLSATTFVINALGQQVRMSAEKALNFRPVVALEIGAAVLGFGAAVSAALAGAGVYSLVLGTIVTSFAATVAAWLFVAQGWRPALRFRLEDVRPYLGFGGAMVVNGIANKINMNMDLLLGGRLLGAGQLGLLSVPRELVLNIQFLINPIITRVGFPLIAQLQHDIPRVRSIYLKTLNMTASTNAPIYVGLAFYAEDVVGVLLGSNWSEASGFLRVLAVWGFLRSTGNPVGSLLMGMGRADLSMKWNLAMLLVVPPVLWWGARFGAEGLVWSLVALSAITVVPGWYLLVRPLCHAGLYEFLLAAFKPLLISLLAVGSSFWMAMALEPSALRMLLGGVTASILYLGISYRANREWLSAMFELVGRRLPAW